ncbi:hypothetical protein CK203_073816 [Vitis vinifera]|uniref:Ninja-family protein n=1 Tax=Vitis vinifera TaxID=29760 RepID=A0A438DJA8_VITVI|nr:hypothetical protein CK203_073816 [Vitis vinifera]
MESSEILKETRMFSIVCFCHVGFLTPAEFVKHAGGNYIANPMKLIVVRLASF